MKILIPIDGSCFSQCSLSFLTSRCALLGKNPDVELLVVIPAVPEHLMNPDNAERYYAQEAQEILNSAHEFLEQRNISASKKFLTGQPAEKIAEEAARINADLVIMGSHGRTAMKGLFLGSVTTGVIARTKNPILIVRNRDDRRQDSLRIGIAVDGSRYGSAAARYLVRHKALFSPNSVFYLIYVANDYAGTQMPDMLGLPLPFFSDEEVRSLQQKDFRTATDAVKTILKNGDIDPKEVCLVGKPGDELANFVRRRRLDLVVVGSHGYGRFKSALMGSTTLRLLAKSNVPVLMIRH